MLLAICQKCDVSADYILGLKKDYINYDHEFVCAYTGLDENAVQILHEWVLNKNNGADLSMIGKAYFECEEEEMIKAHNKQTGIIFLRIINHLFKEKKTGSGNKRKKGKPYSHLRILHSLYLMCMAKPKSITGIPFLGESDSSDNYMTSGNPDPNTPDKELGFVKLDGRETIYMEADNDVTYIVSVKEILEQIARRNLDKAIDDLVSSVKHAF